MMMMMMCKRSARFIAACLCSDNNLFKAVVTRGTLARCHSVVGRSVMFLTRHYCWSLDDFVFGRCWLYGSLFVNCFE